MYRSECLRVIGEGLQLTGDLTAAHAHSTALEVDDNIAKTIRALYATPESTIRILTMLAEGQSLQPDQKAEIVSKFCMEQNESASDLVDLNFRQARHLFGVSLKSATMLDQLAKKRA